MQSAQDVNLPLSYIIIGVILFACVLGGAGAYVYIQIAPPVQKVVAEISFVYSQLYVMRTGNLSYYVKATDTLQGQIVTPIPINLPMGVCERITFNADYSARLIVVNMFPVERSFCS